MNESKRERSNRRKQHGIHAFSFLRSQDSNSDNSDEEEKEEIKTSNDYDTPNFNQPLRNDPPIFPALDRAIQLHYLAQNVRRGFHEDSQGQQHAFVHSTNDHRRRGITTFLSSFITLVKKTMYCTLMMIFIVVSSTLCYTILYNIIMPSNAFTREVFLDYTSTSSPTDRNIMHPRAEIDLMFLHTQWNAYINDIVSPSFRNETDDKPRILEARQSYYIHLALTLPESSINRDIGMFMVHMKLYHSPSSTYTAYNTNISEHDLLLATSSRPAMLPFQSTYVSVVKKSTIMIPLVIGAVPEARTIVVESFDHYLESFEYPLTKVEIELVSTAQNGDSYEKPIQIHRAELRIGIELNWFQRLLKEWFYTCAMVGCFVFATGQVIGWSLIKLFYKIKTKAKRLRRSHLENDLFDDYDEDDLSYLDLSDTDIVQDKDIDEDDNSEQWDPISQEGDDNQSIDDIQQHAVVGDDDNIDQSIQDESKSVRSSKKNKRRNRKKKKSSNHTGSTQDEPIIQEEKNDGLQEVVNRVMQGDIGPYEIFTDLDEPS
jgi:hypothetical protein